MSPLDAAEDLAKELINNHAKFDSFGWRGAPEDSHLWCIVYTTNRDADYLTRSNHKVFSEALAPFCGTVGEDEDLGRVDCQVEHHGHWACGWVDGFSIRVYAPDGTLTPAFLAYAELELARRDYPILDDEGCGKEEEREASETWERCFRPAERIAHLRRYVSPTDNNDKHSYGYGSFAGLLRAIRRGDTGAPYGNDGYYPLTGGCLA